MSVNLKAEWDKIAEKKKPVEDKFIYENTIYTYATIVDFLKERSAHINKTMIVKLDYGEIMKLVKKDYRERGIDKLGTAYTGVHAVLKILGIGAKE